MPRRKHSPEQILGKLREVEVSLQFVHYLIFQMDTFEGGRSIVNATMGGGAGVETMEGLEARRRAEEQSAARERDRLTAQ